MKDCYVTNEDTVFSTHKKRTFWSLIYSKRRVWLKILKSIKPKPYLLPQPLSWPPDMNCPLILNIFIWFPIIAQTHHVLNWCFSSLNKLVLPFQIYWKVPNIPYILILLVLIFPYILIKYIRFLMTFLFPFISDIGNLRFSLFLSVWLNVFQFNRLFSKNQLLLSLTLLSISFISAHFLLLNGLDLICSF